MANRLSRETSPYLKQHADNPVDWYPWGDDALTRARTEDKPILLSVGYSACHWCHVMAHESFEDAETARLMNERFINIKVDREERPDLDHIYQNVAQAMTGGGGWPLTVFLTPDMKPFFGGTYFPPVEKYGRASFKRVLVALSDAYRTERATVLENAGKLMDWIRSNERAPEPVAEGSLRVGLSNAARRLSAAVDRTNGGFGGAPKFPNSMALTFLWRMGYRDEVLLSLARMARGGIYDHLGGGFSRYSVDEKWAVPHFEKMLYDNALLLRLYAEVLLTAMPGEIASERVAEFADVIEGTVGWLLREMRSPDGGFYAAQDADSEGEEGKFFVWTPEQIEEVVGASAAAKVCSRFGVTEQGNFEHGATVLSIQEDPSPGDHELLERCRRDLFAARERRIRPGLDDKILTGWNGLMISGLAWASRALAGQGRGDSASQAMDAAIAGWRFIRDRAWLDGRLHATVQSGRARFAAYLDDHAALAVASLDLLRCAPAGDSARDRELLLDAGLHIDAVIERFSDAAAPGYYFTANDHEALIERPKTLFDNAVPGGTSMALHALSVLSEIDPGGQGARYTAELDRQIKGLAQSIERHPHGYGELACALKLALDGPIVVTGPDLSETHPHVYRKPAEKTSASDWLVCHRKTCSLPIADADALRAEILRCVRRTD